MTISIPSSLVWQFCWDSHQAHHLGRIYFEDGQFYGHQKVLYEAWHFVFRLLLVYLKLDLKSCDNSNSLNSRTQTDLTCYLLAEISSFGFQICRVKFSILDQYVLEWFLLCSRRYLMQIFPLLLYFSFQILVSQIFSNSTSN